MMLKIFFLSVAVLILGAFVQTNDGASAKAKISSLSAADLSTLLSLLGSQGQQTQCSCTDNKNKIQLLEQRVTTLENNANQGTGGNSGGANQGGGNSGGANQGSGSSGGANQGGGSNGNAGYLNGHPTSCASLKAAHPQTPSGYYDIFDGQKITKVYCEMNMAHCGGGAWTRVAYLDMKDHNQACPSVFKEYNGGSKRACGRRTKNCNSIKFPSNSISYNEICGRMIGYQFGSPNSFHFGKNIDQPYVDGVSVTRGDPRNHVWTFAGATYENRYDSQGNCPSCVTPGAPYTIPKVPSFVGNHHYCEAGISGQNWHRVLYPADPLWDGNQCGFMETTCCQAPGIPWFHRVIAQPTNDFIELRVCANEGPGNEDTPIEMYEIYVK